MLVSWTAWTEVVNMWRRTLFVLVLAFVILMASATPASPHLHLHHQHGNSEREEDGAYSPIDSNHVVDGYHHNEFDHEAILGSVKDAEEFDHLDPDEAKRRLRILLRSMDLDKDGLIERNELHAWILRSFTMLSEEESQDRFEDSDADENGYVTWAEYVSDAYGVNNTSDEDDVSSENTAELMSDDKVMFEAADVNKDGVLSKTEFVMFSHPEEHPEMFPLILKQTLEDKDLDKDGFIDFKEFIGSRAHNHDKEWLLAEKDKFDNEYDVDNDGKLNSNEILSWVVPSNDEIAKEEVDHLFASADDDHDNVLSVDEVLLHHDVFVGSEATDYGDHLHNIHVFQDEL